MKFTIVAGAPNQDPQFLKNNVDLDSFIIAADSGYMTCKKAGIVPNLIIGDFDSSKKPGNDVNILQLPSIKNDTDTFYCIKEAVKRKADEIEIFCALGGRTDHEFSNILNLEYCLENNVKASIISEKSVISVHNKDFKISKGEYKYFSLFAIGGNVSGLSIKGAAYELEDFTLSPYASIGQSNEFKSNTVSIEFKNGVLLLILSND